MARLTKAQQAHKAETVTRLRELLKDGKIIINIKHVSRSGMMRHMRVYTPDLMDISHMVAEVLEWGMSDNGVKVGGCGMDMTFHLAYTLTWELYTKEEIKDATFYAAHDSKGHFALRGNGGGCLEWKNI